MDESVSSLVFFVNGTKVSNTNEFRFHNSCVYCFAKITPIMCIS